MEGGCHLPGGVCKLGTVVRVALYHTPALHPVTCFKVSVRVFLSLPALIPLKGQPWSNCIADVWLHAPGSRFDFLVEHILLCKTSTGHLTGALSSL